jgi:hypothetical protein
MTEHTFGGFEDRLLLFLCSYHVPSLFSMIFLKFSIYSFKVFPIGPHFILYPFTKVLPFSPIIYMWTKSEALHPHIKTAILGELTSFNLSFFGWWAHVKRQNLGFLMSFSEIIIIKLITSRLLAAHPRQSYLMLKILSKQAHLRNSKHPPSPWSSC